MVSPDGTRGRSLWGWLLIGVLAVVLVPALLYTALLVVGVVASALQGPEPLTCPQYQAAAGEARREVSILNTEGQFSCDYPAGVRIRFPSNEFRAGGCPGVGTKVADSTGLPGQGDFVICEYEDALTLWWLADAEVWSGRPPTDPS